MELESLLDSDEQRWIDDLLTGVGAGGDVETAGDAVGQVNPVSAAPGALPQPLHNIGLKAVNGSSGGDVLPGKALQLSQSQDLELWSALGPSITRSDLQVGELDLHDLSFGVLEDQAAEVAPTSRGAPPSPQFSASACEAAGASVPFQPEAACHGDAPLTPPQAAAMDSSPTAGARQRVVAADPFSVHASQGVCKAAESSPSISQAGPATPEQSGSGGAACGAAGESSGAQSSSQHIAGRRPADTEDDKARARQMRNRESAAQSRERKKKWVVDLEQRCQQLEHANGQLNAMVQQLTSENASLKCQLASAYSGQPVVPQPAGFGMPFGYAYYTAAPPTATNPKIPIPAAKRARAGPAGSSASKNKSKKSATSAVLLSVVCCLLLVASPWRRDGAVSSLPSSPSESQADDDTLVRSGRVLTALSMDPQPRPPPNGSHASPSLAALQGGGESGSPEASFSANAPLPRLGPVSRVRRQDLALPAIAGPQTEIDTEVMQQLKKLGSLALDGKPATAPSYGSHKASSGARGGSSQASFPLMASSVFGHAGLMSPVTCTEVLRFRRAAAEYQGGEYKARAGDEATRASAGSGSTTGPYRGRKSFAIPLPPAGGEAAGSRQGGGPEEGPKQRIGEDPDDVQVGTIVSVLFPSRNNTGSPPSGDQYDSVGQLYVVMLAPQSSFVAYRCDLPYSVEMRA
mmetsp:Transcript_28260/g.79783  ORF Transcript_28260/g.79783 Transcript_28260/m.79783 type:complete len:690 (-) Transcript_28260:75-2144(-)